MADPLKKLPDLPDAGELQHWLDVGGRPLKVLGAVVVALLILWMALKILRRLRRRRPARLHAKLQVYAGVCGPADEGLAEKRRAEAARIVATSSTDRIAGFEIVEQVEAVFVDGFFRADEALEGLKAASAMKGANAVVNVRQTQGAGRKYSACGDAVVVERARADGRTSSPAERDTPGDGPNDRHPTM